MKNKHKGCCVAIGILALLMLTSCGKFNNTITNNSGKIDAEKYNTEILNEVNQVESEEYNDRIVINLSDYLDTISDIIKSHYLKENNYMMLDIDNQKEVELDLSTDIGGQEYTERATKLNANISKLESKFNNDDKTYFDDLYNDCKEFQELPNVYRDMITDENLRMLINHLEMRQGSLQTNYNKEKAIYWYEAGAGKIDIDKEPYAGPSDEELGVIQGTYTEADDNDPEKLERFYNTRPDYSYLPEVKISPYEKYRAMGYNVDDDGMVLVVEGEPKIPLKEYMEQQRSSETYSYRKQKEQEEQSYKTFNIPESFESCLIVNSDDVGQSEVDKNKLKEALYDYISKYDDRIKFENNSIYYDLSSLTEDDMSGATELPGGYWITWSKYVRKADKYKIENYEYYDDGTFTVTISNDNIFKGIDGAVVNGEVRYNKEPEKIKEGIDYSVEITNDYYMPTGLSDEELQYIIKLPETTEQVEETTEQIEETTEQVEETTESESETNPDEIEEPYLEEETTMEENKQ